jgi:serine/threonine-protein kinase
MSMQLDVTTARSDSRILHDPLPGTGYRALRRLSGGPVSEVWVAVGPDRVRRAVKVLRSFFVDTPEAVFRLEQEGAALAALGHRNLVPVLDVGTTLAGRPFFVMPLLEGETVRERLRRRGPMAPAVACAIVADALAGLDAAHLAGVVHRDVKPENLFLPERKPGAPLRRCVVLDFGIAKVLGAPTGRTTGSRVLGTPRYLAPEQILGGRVDARTDVYAAGITLFEMIAGRGPFDAERDVDLMRAHLDATPRGLRELAGVSSELAHVVARALARSPARRWPSARAFAAVLERAAAREVEGARARAAAALLTVDLSLDTETVQ